MDWFNNVASGASDATEYVGTTEILRPNGATYRDIRRRVGGAIVVNRIEDDDGDPGSDGTEIGYAVYYEFTDALGSPHRITDQWGQPYLDDGSQWFVPFGMRADAGNGDPLDAAERLGFPDSLTRHGWTGHEQADPVGVIQMGGRLYDAEAGRFVQPDPFVQDPFDGQSLNRYSYLLNNPLSGTDPSGYWGAKEQGYLRTVVAVVIAVYTGYYVNTATLTTAQAAGYAALGGAASGAVATGTLRGAVTGAFTGAVGFGIGQAWSAGTWQYVAANATAGGITEELNGGRFGHGFVSAGLSSSIAPQINTGNDFGDGVAYAMLGGTTSVISGGKFGNGAVTGALQFAMGKAGERAAQNRRMEQAAAFDYESAMAFESSAFLRATVPGQVAWDNAVTSWEQGSYGYALLHASAMVGEQMLYVTTLGQSSVSLMAPRMVSVSEGAAGHITGYTRHGLNQAISRDTVGVSPRAIFETVRNPTKVVQQANGTFRYQSRTATVILNQEGKVVSTWARSSEGWR